jgi:hypothetical protein
MTIGIVEETITNAIATEVRGGGLRRDIHDALGEVVDNYPERLGLIVGWISERERDSVGREFLSFARRAVER